MMASSGPTIRPSTLHGEDERDHAAPIGLLAYSLMMVALTG